MCTYYNMFSLPTHTTIVTLANNIVYYMCISFFFYTHHPLPYYYYKPHTILSFVHTLLIFSAVLYFSHRSIIFHIYFPLLYLYKYTHRDWLPVVLIDDENVFYRVLQTLFMHHAQQYVPVCYILVLLDTTIYTIYILNTC